MGTHITVFTQEYPMEKQAEGIGISEAIVNGQCGKCPFLKQCSTDKNFVFPAFAWCQRRKRQILKEWEK